jgi:trans-aconitate 2-methyltransferase
MLSNVMPNWNAEQYLKFADERTRPCRDLAARVQIASPARIVDLGCGPGNSTAVLAERWPSVQITGLDSSPEMIETARRDFPKADWRVGDIATWKAAEPADLVFSNAALQWLDDHAALYPRLLEQAAAHGALAVQVPANYDAPAHTLMRELAESARWRARFTAPVREWHIHEPAFYYDALAPRAARIDLWTTEYLHVLSGPEAIVEWYKGTGLRPFLQALGDADDQERFLADYLREITLAFPPRADGRVLFPFLWLFLVAYR